MNVLRNQVLQEVALLDVRELLALQPVLAALKNVRKTTPDKYGSGAARARRALSAMQSSLADAVREDREERL